MAIAFALSGTNLVAFDTASPAATTTRGITGISAGETLVGIDFRPQNGVLYGLGVNATADTATLYAISTRTGVATAVGTPGGIAFTTDGTTTVDLPDPATVGYGFDFNPAVDRVRVTAGSLNFRLNPNNGTAVDGDNTGLTSGSVVGVNPDGSTNGATTTVDASAYTNNQPNNGNITTLYTLDASSNSLQIQVPANSGTQTLAQTVTLGGNTLDFQSVNGFDIAANVNAAASNTPVVSGSAFAILNVGGTTGLYSIDLVTAAATLIGNVANGATAVQGLAIHNALGGHPAIALSADGASLLRFNTATPGTTATQAITLVAAGETLVGIDFRPATGQLFALGVNATADTATLYRIDPQTGVATAIGATGGIAFTTDGATPIDLPDPATAGYGFDFNPFVDRIRVTTSSGLDFRLNPITGAAVDGDTVIVGTNSDGAINGSGVTGVSAAAYTNNVAGTTVTTLYTLDAASDSLFIQNPPNAGTQTSQIAITLAGSPLNFTDIGGFDIPPGVSASAANAPAVAGFGYASLTVGGVSGLYAINLATGAATNLGAVGAGTAVGGLALGNALYAPLIGSNGGGDTANASVAENATAVTTVSAFDADFEAVSYSIVGGADAARFQIDAATGALAFIAAPNFEAPTDADANNSYIVHVRASDGTLFDQQTITVGVTNVNEFAPVITSNGGGASAFIRIGGGVTAVTTVAATDADAGTAITYSIQGGADAARFQIDPTTGALAFLAAPTFLTPSASSNNSFLVDVRASDGTLSDTQGLTVVWNPFTESTDTVTIGYANGTWDGLGGDDVITGSTGYDALIGGAGNDTLDGGANPSNQGDILLGGIGNDTYFVNSGRDLVDEGNIGEFAVFGFGGTDTIISTADFFWDVYSVGETIRVAETVVDAGDDGVTIVGGVFDNTLIGHSGTDVLFGRGGSDTYRAGDGVDYISLSTLGVMDVGSYVANGVNTVVVEQRTTGANSYDIVYEFESGKDRLDVTDYGFASTAAAFATGVDDGAGNSYFILGDGLDYLYMAGLELSELNANDFIV